MLNNETALQLSPGRLHLIVAPRSLGKPINSSLIARLALSEPLGPRTDPSRAALRPRDYVVRVVDGGNCFDARGIARLLRRQTADLYAALERIQVQRAFTFYQLLAMLVHSSTNAHPLLVLDMLSTIYDENAPVMERLRLLDHSLGQLRRLSSIAPVVVSTPPQPSGWMPTAANPAQAAPPEFLERLEAAADQVWRFEAPSEPLQERLF
jgi:hypothetical protein